MRSPTQVWQDAGTVGRIAVFFVLFVLIRGVLVIAVTTSTPVWLLTVDVLVSALGGALVFGLIHELFVLDLEFTRGRVSGGFVAMLLYYATVAVAYNTGNLSLDSLSPVSRSALSGVLVLVAIGIGWLTGPQSTWLHRIDERLYRRIEQIHEQRREADQCEQELDILGDLKERYWPDTDSADD